MLIWYFYVNLSICDGSPILFTLLFLFYTLFMKTPHSHLLRLCVIEVLATVGFKKTSKQAIDIFTDVTCHVITHLCQDIINNTFDSKAKHNLTSSDLNMFSKSQSKHESLLHKLNILPKGIDYKGKEGGVLHGEMYDEDSFDSYYESFVYEFTDNIESKEVCRHILDYNNNENMKDKLKIETTNTNENNMNDDNTNILLEPLIVGTLDCEWMDAAGYKKVIDRKKPKNLHLYDNKYQCGVVDELRVFVDREADKRCKSTE